MATKANDKTPPSMTGKTVVVTGASAGIGLETARQLAAAGARVLMLVRDRGRGEAAIATIRGTAPAAQLELVLADLYERAQVRAAAAEIRARCPRLDVLVNNAGMIHPARELTVDGVDRSFALNHLAPFVLTYELRALLAASGPARVVTVASEGHRIARIDWDDLPYDAHWPGEFRVYGNSKLCNIWFARIAARRFAGTGVTSSSLHPGTVASSFGSRGSWLVRAGSKLIAPLLLTSAQGARTSVYCASSPECAAITGEYFVKCQVAKPSKLARDDDAAERLWRLSEELCGVSWA